MTNKTNNLFRLANLLAQKYFLVKADDSSTGPSGPMEMFDPQDPAMGMDPNEPSSTAPLQSPFEIFEVKSRILPEFVALTKEQQEKLIQELDKLKKRN